MGSKLKLVRTDLKVLRKPEINLYLGLIWDWDIKADTILESNPLDLRS